MKYYLRIIASILLTSTLAACATSSGVIVSQNLVRAQYQTAYVVAHQDQSRDMDALLEKELLRHGLSVKSGVERDASSDSQLIFKYVDDWKWDIKMYLRAYELEVYDGKTRSLIATADWKNSPAHGYYEEDKIVAQMVDQTLDKISAK